MPKPRVVELPKRGSKKKSRSKKKSQKSSRPKKPHWYTMESFFKSDSQLVMKVGDEDIVLCGWVPPYNEVAVCLVPSSITQQQGLALQKILEANLRAPVLVLTNNTQLVRLKQISESEAIRIMNEGDPNAIVHVEDGEEKEGQKTD